MEQTEKIRIPSIEQLSLERKGKLIVYRLGKTSGNFKSFSLDSFTLNSLVKNLSQLLSKKNSAAQKFEALLIAAGYVKREEYDEKILPTAIIEASYSLNLCELKEVCSNER